MNKVFSHLRTILIHKHYVFLYCAKCGFFFRGLIHDMSKFSPSEFWINAKYYEKGQSPVTIQKEKFGYCESWLHHKSHNKHHYEYWMDRFDDGGYTTRMPFEYTVEQLCDYLGANKAYNQGGGNYTSEWEFWKKKRDKCAMHPDNIKFLNIILRRLMLSEQDKTYKEDIILSKDYLNGVYNSIISQSPYPVQVKISRL